MLLLARTGASRCGVGAAWLCAKAENGSVPSGHGELQISAHPKSEIVLSMEATGESWALTGKGMLRRVCSFSFAADEFVE